MQKYQSKYRRICKQYLNLILLLLTSIINNQGFCQELQNISLFGGPSNDGLTALFVDKDCKLSIGGTYGKGMDFAGENLNSFGNRDLFWGSIDKGQEQLISFGGSTEADKLSAIVGNSQNDLFVAGSFYSTAQFQDATLYSGTNISAAFISKYSESELIWARILNGDSYEEITDMVIDEEDNIYVTGFYNKTLTVNETTITSEAEEAIFLCKMDSEGALLWIRSYGLEGVNRTRVLSYCQKTQHLILSGIYQGVLAFEDSVIQTNTADTDIFVASVSLDGESQWLIKAGGIYNDNVSAMITSEEGDIYLTGSFTGIINIDGKLQIETKGSLDENFFIIKLNHEAAPIWARSLGEQEFSDKGFALGLSKQNELFLAGYTTGSLSIDGINFEPENDIYQNAFVSSFNTINGSMNWIIGTGQISGVLIPSLMQYTACEKLLIGGSIRGSILIQNELHETEAYDGFIAEVNMEPTFVSETREYNESKIYPNPNDGCFYLDLDEEVQFLLYDVNGKFIFEQVVRPEEEVCIQDASGLYFWTTETKKGLRNYGRIIIEN